MRDAVSDSWLNVGDDALIDERALRLWVDRGLAANPPKPRSQILPLARTAHCNVGGRCNSVPMTTCAILLPGSGLGSWIWGKVASDLDQVVTIDYPGEAKMRWGLTDYAHHAVTQIEAAEVENVVLIGHSIGTVVALEAAALLGERVAGLLSIAGAMPPTGGSFLSAFPFPQRTIISTVVRLLGTRPPDGMLRKGLCAGLDEAMTADVIARFAPESQQLFRDAPQNVTTDFARGYIQTSLDKEIPTALQERFAERLGVGFRATVETGHLPMLEAPSELAAAIGEFLATV